MEPIAMANLMSELANWFSLSIYPTIMAIITKGRRSDFTVKDETGLHITQKHKQLWLVKDTDGKHIDPIHCVLVVVPVYSSVAAQQRSGLIASPLRLK